MECDKCHTDVPPSNDATLLDAILMDEPMLAFISVPRHLLPVIVDGTQVCEGSPSRAQYLEGQSRDTRTAYPYDPDREEPIRAAYAALQEEHGIAA